jgi:hypothetical protein
MFGYDQKAQKEIHQKVVKNIADFKKSKKN